MFKKVMVAVDPESEHEGPAALEMGLSLLEAEGELHLVSAVTPDGTEFFPHVPEQSAEEQEAAIRDRLDLMVRKYLPLNRDATVHVIHGAAAKALTALAGTQGADLLILTSHGSGGRWLLPRHTVEHVAVNAPCAVLVLPGRKSKEEGEADPAGES